MTETWYILEDGSLGDPHEIAPDDSGVLRHRDGRAVAYGPHGPRSRGCVDAPAERKKASDAAEAAAAKAAQTSSAAKDLKPDQQPKRGYKTRESKAD